jgi:hypothetical protein
VSKVDFRIAENRIVTFSLLPYITIQTEFACTNIVLNGRVFTLYNELTADWMESAVFAYDKRREKPQMRRRDTRVARISTARTDRGGHESKGTTESKRVRREVRDVEIKAAKAAEAAAAAAEAEAAAKAAVAASSNYIYYFDDDDERQIRGQFYEREVGII